MHRILERQIIRFFGSHEKIPKGLAGFLDLVSKTYDDFEKDHALIERSLEISSRELTFNNERLREEITRAQERANDLEGLNKTMVDRELKMIELKKEIKGLQQEIEMLREKKAAPPKLKK